MLLRPISCHPELYPESMLSYSCASDNNGSKLFPDNWGYSNAEEACNVLSAKGYMLAADTLLHGDFCLPNIILQDWKCSDRRESVAEVYCG